MRKRNTPTVLVHDTHFVDAADSEAESTTFDPSAIHVVADQEYQLIVAG